VELIAKVCKMSFVHFTGQVLSVPKVKGNTRKDIFMITSFSPSKELVVYANPRTCNARRAIIKRAGIFLLKRLNFSLNLKLKSHATEMPKIPMVGDRISNWNGNTVAKYSRLNK